MLSDKEKKAFQYYKECNEKDLENYEYLHEVSQKQAKYLEILLNLIEKQSKEMYYDTCKIESDKKFNIQIGERRIGQTYHLRQKYLLQLGFNINSIGFDFWLTAINLYLKNREISMMTLYNEIGKITNKKARQIERSMRTASETAKENIKKLYDYDGKLSNKSILKLITKFKEE